MTPALRAFALTVVLASTGASAQTARDNTLHLLGLIDSPVSQAQLDRAAGGNAGPALRSIAIDPNVHLLQRQRAAEALVAYRSSKTKEVLLRLLQDPRPPLRKSAVRGLRPYLPDSKVLFALTRALEDADLVVRKAGIRALTGHVSAEPALRRRLSLEADTTARRLLSAALKR